MDELKFIIAHDCNKQQKHEQTIMSLSQYQKMFIRKTPLSKNLLQTRDFNRFCNERLAIAHEIKEINATLFWTLARGYCIYFFWVSKIK